MTLKPNAGEHPADEDYSEAADLQMERHDLMGNLFQDDGLDGDILAAQRNSLDSVGYRTQEMSFESQPLAKDAAAGEQPTAKLASSVHVSKRAKKGGHHHARERSARGAPEGQQGVGLTLDSDQSRKKSHGPTIPDKKPGARQAREPGSSGRASADDPISTQKLASQQPVNCANSTSYQVESVNVSPSATLGRTQVGLISSTNIVFDPKLKSMPMQQSRFTTKQGSTKRGTAGGGKPSEAQELDQEAALGKQKQVPLKELRIMGSAAPVKPEPLPFPQSKGPHYRGQFGMIARSPDYAPRVRGLYD